MGVLQLMYGPKCHYWGRCSGASSLPAADRAPSPCTQTIRACQQTSSAMHAVRSAAAPCHTLQHSKSLPRMRLLLFDTPS